MGHGGSNAFGQTPAALFIVDVPIVELTFPIVQSPLEYKQQYQSKGPNQSGKTRTALVIVVRSTRRNEFAQKTQKQNLVHVYGALDVQFVASKLV